MIHFFIIAGLGSESNEKFLEKVKNALKFGYCDLLITLKYVIMRTFSY
jgi:hypothetical protein